MRAIPLLPLAALLAAGCRDVASPPPSRTIPAVRYYSMGEG